MDKLTQKNGTFIQVCSTSGHFETAHCETCPHKYMYAGMHVLCIHVPYHDAMVPKRAQHNRNTEGALKETFRGTQITTRTTTRDLFFCLS